jgi:hypothetical protein
MDCLNSPRDTPVSLYCCRLLLRRSAGASWTHFKGCKSDAETRQPGYPLLILQIMGQATFPINWKQHSFLSGFIQPLEKFTAGQPTIVGMKKKILVIRAHSEAISLHNFLKSFVFRVLFYIINHFSRLRKDFIKPRCLFWRLCFAHDPNNGVTISSSPLILNFSD